MRTGQKNGVKYAYTAAQEAARDAEEAAWAAGAGARKEAEVRFKRNQLLRLSDHTQIPDSPSDKPPWIQYRQDLRDIPNQIGFPDNVIWPTEP